MYQLILRNFAMHIKLDAAEAELITAKLQHKTVKKKTVLLSAGTICRNIYFVNKGCLRIFNTDNEGQEHNILFNPPNWWAVDIASFSGQTPAFYNIGALEDTDVFYLSYSILEELYTQVPKLERFFRIMTQNGFYLYQQRITSNLSKTAEERYELFQKQYPRLEQRIAQKHIASYLGITPVFLSMIRKRNS
ncbi:cAMP-binding domain of CRP or a regulatory subunit of cAMP-dependent protein kinases [Mucilaginibacter pineti]|uniref:cAMP-binding domain of CRP or a regulatory subunit of cAMP-dependent protein kinases n=1 Tax=Mucilaginibacter pineti TaxID=1391627 RepID=A0A1G7J752_9SPHI|nr:Crp/Fnr family transcriptional regulator [Mucilaginibacter pineti]SDF20339.1 cAMP-binding domain of CRP or a regulatory subunit of cAMP-dependent protein kinases [Mucilaginibacter pineti]